MTVRLHNAPCDYALALAYRADNTWRPLPLIPRDESFIGDDGTVRATLRLEPRADHTAFELSFTSRLRTRLRLSLELSVAAEPFHIIPGFLWGDGNLAHSTPGLIPNLTTQHAGNISCSPYWECRADRATHPVSLLITPGVVAAVSIDPYSEGKPYGDGADDFIRNGVFAQVAADGAPDACGVTLGYGNLPKTFRLSEQFLPSTAHFITAGVARGKLFLFPASSRLDAHRVIRHLYDDLRDTPRPPISPERAARDIVDAFLDVNWHGADGKNGDGSSSGVASPYFGGKPFIENFANMRCMDEQKTHLIAWRTAPEIGWTGGAVLGYPLLAAGHRFNNPVAVERGLYKLDWVANAYNPASGLLWDVSGKNEGTRLNWWWSGPLTSDAHFAYTNGSALSYLLRGALYTRDTMKLPAERTTKWIDTSVKALDTIIQLQLPNGSFGCSYAGDRRAILEPLGFAGAWFLPALALAHRITGEKRFLDAALRSLPFYHHSVRGLDCWGTPMDAWRAHDSEGVLGFIRGVLLLHETTRDPALLRLASDGAEYEYLWRYAYNTRPQCRPLKGSHWNACGGTITNASGANVHTMGVYLSRELIELARLTGDDYHARRGIDGLNYGVNCASLYPDAAGYGRACVLTERFCASDGMTVETYPDGSPASIWFSYNAWSAAAVLEGALACLDM
ncbi:MAG: hypothetical protein K8S99_01545 [Planctomycetes bacterium]|nr:hypothetical protein [Planctomycetota bacterium]